jgi:hypothetical protein
MNKKFISLIGSATLMATLLISPNVTASAAKCLPVKPKGKTIGSIKSGAIDMPIKSFNYPAGGVMEPQKSTLMAALSSRHMPLSSITGTSVLVWHVNYNGCQNALNAISWRGVGSTFKIIDEKGKNKSYVVTERYVVKKGDYQEEWFDLIGPRKLLLVTCTGAFKGGHFEDNVVLIAVPK